MTTAAIGVENLEEALLERRDIAGLSGRLQRRLAKATAGA
jgi:ribosomal protein S18